MKTAELVAITLISLGAGGLFGAYYGQMKSDAEATTHLQFKTVAAGVCTVEGGGKTFMVIDVTKEMRTEEVEGPKEVE